VFAHVRARDGVIVPVTTSWRVFAHVGARDGVIVPVTTRWSMFVRVVTTFVGRGLDRARCDDVCRGF
jgi:hypothetical protein